MTPETITVDVREDIRNGAEPFARIMAAADALTDGQSLVLIAPFEPIPLYAVLANQGFAHQASRVGPGDWEIRFCRESGESALSTESGRPRLVELDCRGLEPPEPMVRILDELMRLPRGGEMRARTDLRPSFLLAELEARGFEGDTQKLCDGSHLTTIRQ